MREIFNGGTWTKARYNSFIKSALRSASQRWPVRYQTLIDSYVGQQINPKSGRLAKHYRCNRCKEVFPAKEVEVNHIEPVVPLSGFTTWDDVIKRMFCEAEGLETVCKPCHKLITKQERDERKINAKSE
jgi:5-methylcytosine-specific restriction endonuclease McrA